MLCHITSHDPRNLTEPRGSYTPTILLTSDKLTHYCCTTIWRMEISDSVSSFRSVVVITLASHARGPGFETQRKQGKEVLVTFTSLPTPFENNMNRPWGQKNHQITDLRWLLVAGERIWLTRGNFISIVGLSVIHSMVQKQSQNS